MIAASVSKRCGQPNIRPRTGLLIYPSSNNSQDQVLSMPCEAWKRSKEMTLSASQLIVANPIMLHNRNYVAQAQLFNHSICILGASNIKTRLKRLTLNGCDVFPGTAFGVVGLTIITAAAA